MDACYRSIESRSGGSRCDLDDWRGAAEAETTARRSSPYDDQLLAHQARADARRPAEADPEGPADGRGRAARRVVARLSRSAPSCRTSAFGSTKKRAPKGANASSRLLADRLAQAREVAGCCRRGRRRPRGGAGPRPSCPRATASKRGFLSLGPAVRLAQHRVVGEAVRAEDRLRVRALRVAPGWSRWRSSRRARARGRGRRRRPAAASPRGARSRPASSPGRTAGRPAPARAGRSSCRARSRRRRGRRAQLPGARVAPRARRAAVAIAVDLQEEGAVLGGVARPADGLRSAEAAAAPRRLPPPGVGVGGGACAGAIGLALRQGRADGEKDGEGPAGGDGVCSGHGRAQSTPSDRRSRTRAGRLKAPGPGAILAAALVGSPEVLAMRTSRLLAVVLAVPLAVTRPLRAADEDEPQKGGPKELAGLKYRLVGPPAGGRVSRVAGVPGDPLTYYAATASGGVWKSTDGGIHWKPIFDDQPIALDRLDRRRPVRPERRLRRLRRGQHPRQRRSRQRHLQVDRRRQDLEARLEAGRPDRHDGRPPDEPRHRLRRGARPRLRPEPRARRLPHHATAARPGSRCSRRTPTPAPPTSRSTRTNPRIVFAGLWQARRRPWELTSGGPGSGLYVSRDGGDTWKQLTGKGLPDGIWGKVGVAVAPSDGAARLRADRGRRRAASSAPTTAARPGRSRATTTRCASAPGTTRRSPSTRANADVVWFPQVPLLQDDRRRQDVPAA